MRSVAPPTRRPAQRAGRERGVNEAAAARCRVRVPATTANLGPGFDCLGMALDLWNDVRFSLEGDGVSVTTRGEHNEELPTDETNPIARSFLRLYEEAGAAPPAGLIIHCGLRVPPRFCRGRAGCPCGRWRS